MATSLSAYWANFFKAAGFTSEVAMKHALVFSNNRIKPDMLSELDKPSLKEMGITLMGDMIAILRYAKKVVEERSCEKFLVDTEQPSKVVKKVPKLIKKKVVTKVIPKPTTSSLKADSTTTRKIVQNSPVTKGKKIIVKKSMSSESATTTEVPLKRPQSVLKRKAEETEDDEDQNDEDQDEEATTNIQPSTAKKVRTISTTQRKVGYAITLPAGLTQRSDQIIIKSQEPKQTVFDRLGNECMDIPNNATESPTKFTVTGLGKGMDVYKRSPSVFNRLGDKDSTRNNVPTLGVIKNGNGSTMSGGILKTQSPVSRTCLITTKQISPRSGGTMRADEEQKRIKLSSIARPIKKNINKIVYNNNPNGEKKSLRNSSLGSGKLASEQPATIPAKARLGVARPSTSVNKQVTFSKVTTVNHYRKPCNADVFSRLGY